MGQSLTANGGCEQNMHIHHALIPSQIWACYIPVVVIQNGWDNRLKTLEYWRESGKKFQCWILSAFKMRLIWSFFSAKGTKGIHDRSFSSHAVIYGILSGQLMSPMIYFMWLVVLSTSNTTLQTSWDWHAVLSTRASQTAITGVVLLKHVEARAQSSWKPQKGRTCEVELSAESQKRHPGAGQSFKIRMLFIFNWTEGIPGFVVSVSCILARPDPPLTSCYFNLRILKAPPAQ